jgi:hypothetical protein
MLRCCLRCKPGTDVIPVTVLRAWQVDDGINGPAAKSGFVLLYDLFLWVQEGDTMGTGRRYHAPSSVRARSCMCARVCVCVVCASVLSACAIA